MSSSVSKQNLKFNLGGVFFLILAALSLLNSSINIIQRVDFYQKYHTSINAADILALFIPSVAGIAVTVLFAVFCLKKISNGLMLIPIGLRIFGTAFTIASTIASLTVSYKNIKYAPINKCVDGLNLLQLALLLFAYVALLAMVILHLCKRTKVVRIFKIIAEIIIISNTSLNVFLNIISWILRIYVNNSNAYTVHYVYNWVGIGLSLIISIVCAVALILLGLWFINPYKSGCSPEEVASEDTDGTTESEATASEADTTEEKAEVTAVTGPVVINHPVSQESHAEKIQKLFAKYSLPLWQHVLLVLLTGGIWNAIWAFRMTELCNHSRFEKRGRIGCMLLYYFVPFYYIYWNYQTAKRIDSLSWEAGQRSDLAIISLILSILVKVVPPILIQDKVNAIAEEK